MGLRVAEPWEYERTRVCKVCCVEKPWIEFPPNRKAPDGRVLSIKAQCHKCIGAAVRTRRLEFPREPMNGRERIPDPKEWILSKRCPQCEETKAWAFYSPLEYWPDGSVKRVQSWCRVCKANANRGRRPVPTVAEKKAKLAWAKEKRAAIAADRKSGGSPITSPQNYLPVGPFREWLRQQAGVNGDWGALADECCVNDRALRRIMDPNQQWASVVLVDKCLTKTGYHLDDLYPLAA